MLGVASDSLVLSETAVAVIPLSNNGNKCDEVDRLVCLKSMFMLEAASWASVV